MALDVQLSVTDVWAFTLSIAGIIIALCCILLQWARGPHSRDPAFEDEVYEWLRARTHCEESAFQVLLEDYSVSLEEVGRRDNLTLLTGTILITASFILLGNTVFNQDFPKWTFAFASLGLYLIWLLSFHETAQKLNRLAFQRVRAIERGLTRYFEFGSSETHPTYSFGIHSYFTDRTEGGTAPWLRMVRRIFWYLVLLLLASSWMLLSISIT